MHKIDTEGRVYLVPVGFVPIVEEYTDPEYTGGLYPLGEIVNLQAYIDYVDAQGGVLRDVNATCAVEGVTEIVYSSNEVTIVYTNRHTGETFTETQTVTQTPNTLSFEPLHTDAGNYSFDILLDGVLIYRGAYCTEDDSVTTITTDKDIESVTGDAEVSTVQSDHTVEKVAREASIEVVEGDKSVTFSSREQEKTTLSREQEKTTVSRPTEKTTVSRNGLYEYTSR